MNNNIDKEEVLQVPSVKEFHHAGNYCFGFNPYLHEYIFDGETYTTLNTVFNSDGSVQGFNYETRPTDL